MTTAAMRDLTRPLLAFWVGDYDIFAAEDDAKALMLANAIAGQGTYILDDVVLVTFATLDEPLQSDDGPTTLRQMLVSAEPGYLAGYEQ